MERKKEKIEYCVYNFMSELGLRGSVCTIYAFIYAYRKSEAGFFFGKRQLIADRCQVSLRTVERGISKLLKLGYIEHAKSGKYRGLRASECFIPDSEKAENNGDSLGDGQLVSETRTKYEPVELGHGYFDVSREQYNALLELVPLDKLENYVMKMERMLEKNMASGIHPPKNYYRTLKKWINEDYKV